MTGFGALCCDVMCFGDLATDSRSVNKASQSGPRHSDLWESIVRNDRSDGHYRSASHALLEHRRLYPLRWWLVVVFSALGILQAASWNFYAPISSSVQTVFNWPEIVVEWLPNTAGIAMVLSLSFFSMVIDIRGARFSTLLSVGFLVLCCALRAIPLSWLSSAKTPLHSHWTDQPHAWLCFGSMVLNGLSAPGIALAPPILSAAWFPVHERTTATAIMTTMNYLGTSVGFVLGPLVVDASAAPAVITRQLERLYLVLAIVAASLFLAVFLYFPSAPPTPPTLSAEVEKTEFTVGFKRLLRHKRNWLLCIACGVPTGFYGGWSAVLDLNLRAFGLDEIQVGWLGCLSTASGCFFGILISAISDRFAGRLKQFIISMYCCAALSFLWFALTCSKMIPGSTVTLYASSILGGLFLNGTIPLFYELCVETTFPIPEGSTVGFLVLVMNSMQTVWMAVPLQQLGTAWMNWSLVVVIPAAVLLMSTFEEDYARARIDRGV